MEYTEHEDSFEFTRSSSLNMAIILLVGMLLLVGGLYSLFSIDTPYNYIVAAPIFLFFLLLTLSVYPAITAFKMQQDVLVWGANKTGLIVPARKSSLVEYLAPDIVPWETINTATYAQKLIDRSDKFEVSVSVNILVVELKNGKRLLFPYPQTLEHVLFDFFSLAGRCENRTCRLEEVEIL